MINQLWDNRGRRKEDLNLTKHLSTIEIFDGIELDYPCVFYFEFFWSAAKQLKDRFVVVFRLFENTFDEVLSFVNEKSVYVWQSKESSESQN